MSWSIYCIEHILSGRKYIGLSKHPTARKCWHKHSHKHTNTHISHAIGKYGWEAFSFIILEHSLSQEQAKIKEKEYISKYNTFKNGFNSTEGGDGTCGRKWTDKQKKKLSKERRGLNNPFYGKRHNKETRKLFREKSKASKGNQMLQPNRKPITINNIRYVSIREACRQLNITKYMAKKLSKS